MALTSPYALGIDLGTTNICMGVFRNGRVDIIPNQQSSHLTPSYMRIAENELVFGNIAKEYAHRFPETTIYDVKRLIGCKYSDVLNNLNRWPFEILNNNDRPKIKVRGKTFTREMNPEEVSGHILEHLQEQARAYLNVPDGISINAVITVPAHFNDSQRQATIDAGKLAGLNVMKLINEPTAAAIAYGLHTNADKKTILVFDLGGGTFDVSIVTIEDEIYEVKSTDGDTNLGGIDFDNNLIDYLIDRVKEEINIDLHKDRRNLIRVRAQAERCKCELSFIPTFQIELASVDDEDVIVDITRAHFEDMNLKLFEEAINIVNRCINKAGFNKQDIDEIVLVGGSTKIPKLRGMLSSNFGNKKLNEGINPDEAVAYGASIHAAFLNGDQNSLIRNLVFLDVTALSLGVETSGGQMNIIINKNTTLPKKVSKLYSPKSENQATVLIKVYEGENKLTKDNNLLGKFFLSNLPLASRGTLKIEVTFHIDVSGILNVSAIETSTGINHVLSSKVEKGRMTSNEIEELRSKMKSMKLNGDNCRATNEAKNELIAFCKAMITKVSNDNDISTSDRHFIARICGEHIVEVENNSEMSQHDIEEKNRKLRNKCTVILKRYD